MFSNSSGFLPFDLMYMNVSLKNTNMHEKKNLYNQLRIYQVKIKLPPLLNFDEHKNYLQIIISTNKN